MDDPAIDRNVDRFGRWADTYDRSLLQRVLFGPLQEMVLEQAALDVPTPSSLLDMGCGTGQLLHRASRHFPEATLTGVDASKDMVRVAQAAVPLGAPVSFVEAFAERLPFDDGAFDLVTTTMSFHHWADQPAALREVRRVMAPGAAFLLADALAAGLLRGVFGHEGGRFNTPERLSEMLRGAGLTVERSKRALRSGGTIQVVVSRASAG
jgi:ubiquinone/menaquinone biosynthesis C-methylase UbiE